MSIQVVQTKASPELHSVLLEVTKGGMDVTIAAGNFRVAGVDYALGEDYVFTATNRPEESSIVATLAFDTGESKVAVVVDELVKDPDDGWDDLYDWKGSQYTRIHNLWILSRVPGGTTTLDDVKLEVFHIVDFPSEG